MPGTVSSTLHLFSSVQFSRSVVSDSLRPHESQHSRPPCPSPSPGVHSDSRPSSPWWPSSHLILGRPLLLLPPVPPSIRVFSNESALRVRWPKDWSFSFSIKGLFLNLCLGDLIPLQSRYHAINSENFIAGKALGEQVILRWTGLHQFGLPQAQIRN